jgi:hypothetical protein
MQILDVSNACLGFLNSCTLVGGMIESGQIEAGVVVCGENGGPLVEETIRRLCTSELDRQQIKPFFANLTIGSGAVAAVLCRRDLAPSGAPRLVGGVVRAASEYSSLCMGDRAEGDALAMQTDSEQLLVAGVETARRTWADLGNEFGFAERTLTGSCATKWASRTGGSCTRRSGSIRRRISRRSRRWATPAPSRCRSRCGRRARLGSSGPANVSACWASAAESTA